MDIQVAIALITSAIAILTVIYNRGFEWGNLKSEVKTLKETVESLKRDISELRSDFKVLAVIANDCRLKIEPFWELIRQNLPSLINVQKSGNLVEKLLNDTITSEELKYLEERIQNLETKDNADKLARILALWALDIKRGERMSRRRTE